MLSLYLFIGVVSAQGGLVVNPKDANNGPSGTGSMPMDLSGMVNNRGFAMYPGDADFDGIHSG